MYVYMYIIYVCLITQRFEVEGPPTGEGHSKEDPTTKRPSNLINLNEITAKFFESVSEYRY